MQSYICSIRHSYLTLTVMLCIMLQLRWQDMTHETL